jgi:hypothetical protein
VKRLDDDVRHAATCRVTPHRRHRAVRRPGVSVESLLVGDCSNRALRVAESILRAVVPRWFLSFFGRITMADVNVNFIAVPTA